MLFKSFLLIFFIVVECVTNEEPTIRTKSGKIRGHFLTSYKGNRYEAYQGIPFALPPTGHRRFRPPVPIKPWSGELKATNMSQPCPQKRLTSNEIFGSEDCLYLNIYVPQSKKGNELLPIIFYIHGGAYQIDSYVEGEESYIIDYDIIFVSVQYRLGVLGFLSTEDHVVPGNMGLKDQSTALRWIHNNIEHFGGDTKRITLLGASAGASSVHYHYLSSWSRGLFHAGISISGTAFLPWALTEGSHEMTIELGQELNCSDKNIIVMIKCLRVEPIDTLLSAIPKLTVAQNELFVPYAPVVERSSTNPFVDDLPSRIINRGEAYDVPWIVGEVRDEGLLLTACALQIYFCINEIYVRRLKYKNIHLIVVANEASLKYFDANWLKIAPLWLDFYCTIPIEQHRNVSTMVQKHYFKNKPINMSTFYILTNLVSDRLFKVSAANAVGLQASKTRSPVFYYHYSYRAIDSNTNSTKVFGVCHSDDIDMVLKKTVVDPRKSPKDMAMQARLIRLWASVAHYDLPDVGVEWRRVDAKSTTFDYLQINDPNDFSMTSSDTFAHVKFWNSIDFNENNIF